MVEPRPGLGLRHLMECQNGEDTILKYRIRKSIL